MGFLDGGQEVGSDARLDHIAQRPGLQRLPGEVRIVVHREEDDARLDPGLLQAMDRFDPVHHRHGNIEYQNVGL